MLGRVAGPITELAVAGCNALTVRWARSHRDRRSTVMAGAGVWPLLAILAAGADGTARQELENATQIRAEDATEVARSAFALLGSCRAISTALGVWIASGISVRDSWHKYLPPGTLGRLQGDDHDQRRLDRWAEEKTLGIIPQIPVSIDAGTLLLLASALTVRTRWLRTFRTDDFPSFTSKGPWVRRHDFTTIGRTGPEVDEVSVVTSSSLGPMTLLEVQGESDITVFLVLADQAAVPGDVMAEAANAVASHAPRRLGSWLRDGETAPGLSARTVTSEAASPPTIDIVTVPFRIESQHDLLNEASIFGLEAARDRSAGHFAAISPTPLYVQQAKQEAMAAFSAEGFESAAVTAMGISLGAHIGREEAHKHLEISVQYDRPFAFLSVHRPSGLILGTGWVAEPQTVTNPEVLSFPDVLGV
jgi:serine protease inhibitor